MNKKYECHLSAYGCCIFGGPYPWSQTTEPPHPAAQQSTAPMKSISCRRLQRSRPGASSSGRQNRWGPLPPLLQSGRSPIRKFQCLILRLHRAQRQPCPGGVDLRQETHPDSGSAQDMEQQLA